MPVVLPSRHSASGKSTHVHSPGGESGSGSPSHGEGGGSPVVSLLVVDGSPVVGSSVVVDGPPVVGSSEVVGPALVGPADGSASVDVPSLVPAVSSLVPVSVAES